MLFHFADTIAGLHCRIPAPARPLLRSIGTALFVQESIRGFAPWNNPRTPRYSMNTLTDTTVQITREISAPRDRVYAAWTDLKLARQWWGPEGVETRALVIEPR